MAQPPDPTAVRMRLLGSFRVFVGSRTVEESGWRLKKAAGLVKLLALAPDHRLHREQVTEALWPSQGRRMASNSFRQTLYIARRTLDPDAAVASRLLDYREEHLTLCARHPLWVDVEVFEEAASTARKEKEPAAYRAAIDLYAGDLLPADRYEEWAEERRSELRRTFLSLLVELASLCEGRGEYEAAVEALARTVANEPAHEHAHLGLMRLYARSGRPAESLRQYERLEEILTRVLGTHPETETRRLREDIAAGRFPPDGAGDPAVENGPEKTAWTPRHHNLPAALTSFVGRRHEMLEVKRALAMTRLLTLTGAGGSGKTRLALEVGRDLVGAYPDGVWLVELASLSEGTLVPPAVARVLGVQERAGQPLTDTIGEVLRGKQMLLVLDNCEHLVDAAAHLAEVLLRACPKLRILTTSRETLGVPGEAVWPVPPLSLPEEDPAHTTEGMMRSEAVRLFLDRAHSRLPDFELNVENAGSVARMCSKLDGIPLAIELATARMGALAVEQIAERLEASLKLLTAGSRTAEPRHRTMRATLDWSHELLDEKERVLFGRLSVFAGGWTLRAAEEVCAGAGIQQGSVLDLLSRLVDKSLVVAEAGRGAVRYRMLEPIRQYGRERLELSGEIERFRERHAVFYLALAEEAYAREPGINLKPTQPLAWLERMEAEHGNLTAAVSWALDREETGEREAGLGIRLAGALWSFWYAHYYESEGRRYLESALSGKSNPATARSRALALIGAGWLAINRADFGEAKILMEEGLALCRKVGDREGIASALTELGWVAVLGQRDDIPLAAVFEELMELKPQLKNRNTLAYLLLLEAAIVGSRGDLGLSAKLHEESLELFREMHDDLGTIMCLSNFGTVELLRANHESAAALLHEALRGLWVLDAKPGIQVCLHGLGCVAARLAMPIRAARLWGAVEGMQEAYGVHLTPVVHSLTGYEDLLAAARSQLGEEAFAAAWAEGKAMPLERAIEYALSEQEAAENVDPKSTPAKQPPAPSNSLTRREREVATLVTHGLTNRQIASELVLSRHTVDKHMKNILKKLALHSREQVASHLRGQ